MSDSAGRASGPPFPPPQTHATPSTQPGTPAAAPHPMTQRTTASPFPPAATPPAEAAHKPDAKADDPLPFMNELHWLVNGVISRARHPNGNIRVVTRKEFAEFEVALRKLETRWEERERQILTSEIALRNERTELDMIRRGIRAQTDTLEVREQLVAVTRAPAPAEPLPAEAQAALEELRARLNSQETELTSLRHELDERQRFLEEAEARLTRKMEAQDHMSALLDQRSEELELREQSLATKQQPQHPPP